MGAFDVDAVFADSEIRRCRKMPKNASHAKRQDKTPSTSRQGGPRNESPTRTQKSNRERTNGPGQPSEAGKTQPRTASGTIGTVDPMGGSLAQVPTGWITVPTERLRKASPEKVRELVLNISANGLLHPIGLKPDYELVYGLHRFEALKELGWQKIPVVIRDYDQLRAELAEIDENLVRSSLTAAEELKAVSRRKVLYEQLHPGAKQGQHGRRGSGKGEQISKSDIPSFSEDMASKVGKSRRKFERDAQVGAALDDAAVAALGDHSVTNNKSQLARLSELPPTKQRQVAKKLAGGKARTVEEALGTPVENARSGKAHEALRLLAKLRSLLEFLQLGRQLLKPIQAIQAALEAITADTQPAEDELTPSKPRRGRPKRTKPADSPVDDSVDEIPPEEIEEAADEPFEEGDAEFTEAPTDDPEDFAEEVEEAVEEEDADADLDEENEQSGDEELDEPFDEEAEEIDESGDAFEELGEDDAEVEEEYDDE